jgi:hypothetical protein
MPKRWVGYRIFLTLLWQLKKQQQANKKQKQTQVPMFGKLGRYSRGKKE